MAKEYLDEKINLLNEILENTKAQTNAVKGDEEELLDNLISKRKELMDKVDLLDKEASLSSPANEESEKKDKIQAILKEIIDLNKRNEELVEKEMEDSQKELRKINVGRQGSARYGSEYGLYKEEGVFFDTKE